MTANTRQRLLFVLLISSVLFGVYMKPWQRRAPVAPPDPVAAGGSDTAAATAMPRVVEINYSAAWPDRDPFSRSGGVFKASVASSDESFSVAFPSVTLQGILTVDGQAVCVIDGESCPVGSHIAGWRVETIETKGVWLSQGGERHFVPLP